MSFFFFLIYPKMDLQTEIQIALSSEKTEETDGTEGTERTEERKIGFYYDIDEMKNIEQPNKKIISLFFQLQSNSLSSMKKYFIERFDLRYEDEQEIERRSKNIGKKDKYTVIDPFFRFDFVDASNQRIKGWKFIHSGHKIVSNNEKLFNFLIEKMDYENGGTMAKLGLIRYIEPRQIGKWYCLDIRKHLDINIQKRSDGIVSFNVNEQTVYYSYIHKIWGFDWNNFKVVYKVLIGHDYSHQEVIISRLENTIDSTEYAVLECYSKRKNFTVNKEIAHDYLFFCDKNRIVSNDEILFKNYIQVVPIYRRGYRKTIS